MTALLEYLDLRLSAKPVLQPRPILQKVISETLRPLFFFLQGHALHTIARRRQKQPSCYLAQSQIEGVWQLYLTIRIWYNHKCMVKHIILYVYSTYHACMVCIVRVWYETCDLIQGNCSKLHIRQNQNNITSIQPHHCTISFQPKLWSTYSRLIVAGGRGEFTVM